MNNPYDTTKVPPKNDSSKFVFGTRCLIGATVWIFISGLLVSWLLYDLIRGMNLSEVYGGYPTLLVIFSGFFFGIPLGFIGVLYQLIYLKEKSE